MFGDPTIGDAILDRVVHRAHRIELKGPSLRKRQAVNTVAENDEILTNAKGDETRSTVSGSDQKQAMLLAIARDGTRRAHDHDPRIRCSRSAGLADHDQRNAHTGSPMMMVSVAEAQGRRRGCATTVDHL